MAPFDIANRIDRDIRHCRTRAFVARLFAGHPINPSNSQVWLEVARSWDQLAALKEEVAQTENRIRAGQAQLDAMLTGYTTPRDPACK